MIYRHKLLHTSADKFSCTVCGKGFSRKVHLNNHIKLHKDDKRFKVVSMLNYNFTLAKIVKNLPRTYKKLNCKGKPYNFND